MKRIVVLVTLIGIATTGVVCAAAETLSPTPVLRPLMQDDAACVQGLYIIDGTSSGPEQNNLMSHLFEWASARPGCVLIKRYYSGIGKWLGQGINEIVHDAMRDICRDVLDQHPSAQLSRPVREVGLIGFSRGALAAVTIANRFRSGECGRSLVAGITFVGLVDPVRTTIANMDGDLAPGISRTIQIIKEQYPSIDPDRLALWTHIVGNVPHVIVHGIEHADMNCLKPASQPIEDRLTREAELAGFSFGPHTRNGGKCLAGPGSTQRLVKVMRPPR